MRAVLIGLLALLVSAPAMGDSIPASILEKDRRNCVAGRVGNDAVEVVCLCFVLAIQREMSLQEYLTFDGEMRQKIASGHSVQTAADSYPGIFRAKKSCGLVR